MEKDLRDLWYIGGSDLKNLMAEVERLAVTEDQRLKAFITIRSALDGWLSKDIAYMFALHWLLED